MCSIILGIKRLTCLQMTRDDLFNVRILFFPQNKRYNLIFSRPTHPLSGTSQQPLPDLPQLHISLSFPILSTQPYPLSLLLLKKLASSINNVYSVSPHSTLSVRPASWLVSSMPTQLIPLLLSLVDTVVPLSSHFSHNPLTVKLSPAKNTRSLCIAFSMVEMK